MSVMTPELPSCSMLLPLPDVHHRARRDFAGSSAWRRDAIFIDRPCHHHLGVFDTTAPDPVFPAGRSDAAIRTWLNRSDRRRWAVNIGVDPQITVDWW